MFIKQSNTNRAIIRQVLDANPQGLTSREVRQKVLAIRAVSHEVIACTLSQMVQAREAKALGKVECEHCLTSAMRYVAGANAVK